MFSLKRVSVNFGKRLVLRDVSLDIPLSSYTALVGNNGAGKTSLLRTLLGIIRPTQGKIEFNGLELKSYTAKERAKLIAYVPQQLDISLSMRVFDFVALARFPYSSPLGTLSKQDNYIVENSLGLTDCESLAEQDMQALSGGERQRVHIAAALAQQAKVLLLDEMSHFLDPAYEEELNTLISTLQQTQELSVVSVSHDLNEVSLRSKRVIALKAGEVVFDGSTPDFMREEVLKKVFGKSFLLMAHPKHPARIVIPEAPAHS